MSDNDKEAAKIIYVPAYSDPGSAAADEIDLREVWLCLNRGKVVILGFSAICTLAALLIVFLVMPETYKSSAVLAPAQSPEDAASQLSGLSGQLGIPISLPGGNKSNSIMAFLASRNLKEKLLRKYELLPRLYPKLWDAERKAWRAKDPAETPTVISALQKEALRKIYAVSQDSASNLITITWIDREPAFSSLMLERIITELQHYLDSEYVSDAQREREFIEQQLRKATAELEGWEQQLPSQNLPLAKILRERLATQTVYTELRRQLEVAKIAEAKELIRFKVLDPPFVPEKKFRPQRTLIIGLTLLLAAALAAAGVLLRHFSRRPAAARNLPCARA